MRIETDFYVVRILFGFLDRCFMGLETVWDRDFRSNWLTKIKLFELSTQPVVLPSYVDDQSQEVQMAVYKVIVSGIHLNPDAVLKEANKVVDK